jgi:hypothetical protein
VRRVHLDEVEPGRQRPAGGGDERLAHLDELVDGQGVRHRVAGRRRDLAGRHRLPGLLAGAGVLGRHRAAAVPRPQAAGLGAGVRQLDAGDRALRVQEVDDPGQPGDLTVVPQADVPVADPTLRGDTRGLDHHGAETPEREPAEVHEVVVADEAVGDRVLAHRGHDQAVRQRHAAQGQGLEEGGGAHGHG